MKDSEKEEMMQRFFKPRAPNEKVQTRKDEFAAVNAYVAARNGFVVSVPGDREITIECLPASSLPDELAAGGAQVTVKDRVGRSNTTTLPAYDVREIGEGQRILPTAITEMVVTEGSTIARPVQHAGIVSVVRYQICI